MRTKEEHRYGQKARNCCVFLLAAPGWRGADRLLSENAATRLRPGTRKPGSAIRAHGIVASREATGRSTGTGDRAALASLSVFEGRDLFDGADPQQRMAKMGIETNVVVTLSSLSQTSS